MLTTRDLYERHGYCIDVGDRVRFKLLRGWGLRTTDEEYWVSSESKIVQKLKNPNSNRTVTGTIVHYQPWGIDDLEIDVKMRDGYVAILKLHQCHDLRVLGWGR